MKIYLISRPTINDSGLNSFLNDEGQNWRRTPNTKDSEDIVEMAGRICHMSFGCKQVTGSNCDFIENLIDKQHESVLEHATWTFIATGVTRSLTHQLVRHRIGFSFSQMSQQYNDQTAFKFVVPPGLDEDENIRQELEKAEKASRDAYSNLKKLIMEQQSSRAIKELRAIKKEDKKLLRSAARSVLPNCIETKIAFSANGRSIRHFLKLRGSVVWDIEMRLFCHELLLIMKQEAHNIFRDFTINIHEDGYPIILHNKANSADAKSRAAD